MANKKQSTASSFSPDSMSLVFDTKKGNKVKLYGVEKKGNQYFHLIKNIETKEHVTISDSMLEKMLTEDSLKRLRQTKNT